MRDVGEILRQVAKRAEQNVVSSDPEPVSQPLTEINHDRGDCWQPAPFVDFAPAVKNASFPDAMVPPGGDTECVPDSLTLKDCFELD